MQLFPHNQRAFDSASLIFEVSNRTCVIHPTGTGKSLVIAEFIVRNPGARHLILAPGGHIFDEIAKYADFRVFDCLTYSKIRGNIVARLPKYDFIYFDEFHRIGAEIWGANVLKLLEANPNAKILGTTATHIRFLDDARDMASELFGGNVASFLSLNRAIAEGILRAPKYVSAIYSIDDEFKALAAKIEGSNRKEKKVLTLKLKQNVIDWNKTSGLDKVFNRHMPADRKRIAAFCQTLDDMKKAERVLLPILREIFPAIQVCHVHSRFPKQANEEALNEFRAKDDKAKVLFSVNKVNEGLHGKDISVCILMRETASGNIFYQQIGRCFSADQELQPIIFDLVNNFSNVQIDMFKREFESEANKLNDSDGSLIGGGRSGLTTIEFIDETKGIRDLFLLLDAQIDNWPAMYARASQFFAQNGHLYVNGEVDGQLQSWIYRQRSNKKSLSEEQVKKLDEIGMDWTRSIENTWLGHFSKFKILLKEAEYDPSKLTDRFIRRWFVIQKKRFREGRLPEQQEQLLAAVVSLNRFKEVNWDQKVKELRQCKEAGFKFTLSESNPYRLVIMAVRRAIRDGGAPAKLEAELRDLNFPLETNLIRKKGAWLQDLKAFYSENSRPPTYSENKGLAKWMKQQRGKSKRGLLSQELQSELESMGVIQHGQRNPKVIEGNEYFKAVG